MKKKFARGSKKLRKIYTTGNEYHTGRMSGYVI